MKKTIMTLCLAFCATLAMQAQDTKAKSDKPAHDQKHECLMAGDETWTALGLTAEQVTKVKAVQTSCKKDKMAAKDDATAMASMTKHETELKGILTPDQYTKYNAWCAEQHGHKPKSELKSDGDHMKK